MPKATHLNKMGGKTQSSKAVAQSLSERQVVETIDEDSTIQKSQEQSSIPISSTIVTITLALGRLLLISCALIVAPPVSALVANKLCTHCHTSHQHTSCQ
jgi:hypothetical protein